MVMVVVVVSTTEFWASLRPPSNALKPNYVSSFQLEKYLFCFFFNRNWCFFKKCLHCREFYLIYWSTQMLEIVASVSWTLIFMIGILQPWLANHLFSQSSSEIAKSNKQPKAPCTCFCVYYFKCFGLIYFERNTWNLYFVQLNLSAFHMCARSTFWFLISKESNWFEKL